MEPLVRAIVTVMPAAQVVVIDDNSPDGTANKVAELQDSVPQLNLLLRTTNRGFAPSYLDGFRWARLHTFDVVVTMDADYSHDPKYLPAIVGALENSDVAVGSRYAMGGGVQNWPWHRQAFSRGANLIAQRLTGVPARDVT
ncbi:MAG: glycosyltransferase, partial [bacterium]